jgi:hypothetical protein
LPAPHVSAPFSTEPDSFYPDLIALARKAFERG